MMDTSTYNLQKLNSCSLIETGSEVVRNWLYKENTRQKPNYFWIGLKDDPTTRVYQFTGWKKCVAFLSGPGGDQPQFAKLKEIVGGL
jgi:hypothetical protein